MTSRSSSRSSPTSFWTDLPAAPPQQTSAAAYDNPSRSLAGGSDDGIRLPPQRVANCWLKIARRLASLLAVQGSAVTGGPGSSFDSWTWRRDVCAVVGYGVRAHAQPCLGPRPGFASRPTRRQQLTSAPPVRRVASRPLRADLVSVDNRSACRSPAKAGADIASGRPRLRTEGWGSPQGCPSHPKRQRRRVGRC
jgi:hypothetical protein